MKLRLAVLALILGLVIVGTACGKKASEPSPSAPASKKVESPQHTTPAQSPTDLGNKIGSSYLETLKQVVAILNDKPPAADAKKTLQEFKEATIGLMVGLGQEREALSPQDRAQADAVLRFRISSVPSELFKSYQDAQSACQSDRDLFNLIADFNIITQYAIFELLKKQLPDEAKRLGIQ